MNKTNKISKGVREKIKRRRNNKKIKKMKIKWMKEKNQKTC